MIGNRFTKFGAGSLTRKTTESGQSVIVYDDELISHIDESFFDHSRWAGAKTVDGLGRGRGKALLIEYENQQWVLRHYYRGGLVSRLSTDRFLWAGLSMARSFREWSLLEHMCRSGLPVPRPVAARVRRRGVGYTADLITVRIPNVRTLSARLSAESLNSELWHSVGRLIATFHAAGICHADLNAHNIQIDSGNNLYLLDFDRGRVRNSPGRWMQGNLDRLQRSLTKLLNQGVIHFRPDDWTSLLDGYRSALDDVAGIAG